MPFSLYLRWPRLPGWQCFAYWYKPGRRDWLLAELPR